MQYYKVELTVNSDGTVIEKVIASGTNCTTVTEQLEKVLGEVRSQELLPEASIETETISEDSIWASRS